MLHSVDMVCLIGSFFSYHLVFLRVLIARMSQEKPLEARRKHEHPGGRAKRKSQEDQGITQ